MKAEHDSRNAAFRWPLGACEAGGRVRLSVRVEGAEKASGELRIWQDGAGELRLPLKGETEGESIWLSSSLTLPENGTLLWYRFELLIDGKKIFCGQAADELGGSGAFSGRSSRAARQQSLDLTSSLTVSFRDAALGATKRIQLQDPSATGSKASLTTLEVKIPAGIEEGKKIRLRGRGMAGADGKKGDLLIEIHIDPDSEYTRDGLNLYTSAQIPYSTAVLGGEAMLPTLHGMVSCKIPAGIQSGSKIRLKEKGIHTEGRVPKKGDEFVEIRIAVPRNISPAARKKLEEYAKLVN